MGYIYLQTIAETPLFVRRARKLLSEDEYDNMIAFLAAYPLAGDEIVGTGGVRKIRFSAKGRGKSGGVRVIYYFYDQDIPIYALLVYGKNERADLTSEQRRIVAAFAAAIKTARKNR
jgi:mRNA-degrading endonuclease RelE of RelBE toxin-antitoxin system